MKFTYYRRKKRIKLLVILVVAVIGAGGVFCYWLSERAEKEDYIGAEQELPETGRDWNEAGENHADADTTDVKGGERYLYEVEGLKYPELSGDFGKIDIRIRYPDGTGYLVIGKTEVFSESTGRKLVYVNEEELLRLLSAERDVRLFEGSSLFATVYREEWCDGPVPDYTPSIPTIELVLANPNIEEIQGKYLDTEKRKEIEERIVFYMAEERKLQGEMQDAGDEEAENTFYTYPDNW